MAKHYHRETYYVCELSNELCQSNGSEDLQSYAPPDCKDCEYYIEWKKSRLSINDFRDWYISGKARNLEGAK